MCSRFAIVSLLLVALALALLPAAAPGATPRTTLPDVEDEVMCTQCGTALNISDAPVADRERVYIQDLIDQGKTKAEIKAALKEEYGPRVLAVPSSGGFDAAAYAVPLALGILGLLGVAYAATRWRRRRTEAEGPTDSETESPGLDPTDARRLDAELAAFDR